MRRTNRRSFIGAGLGAGAALAGLKLERTGAARASTISSAIR
jgi:hypothetical protein